MSNHNDNLEAIGRYLRETRQEQGLDLYDMSDRLRIRPGYLFAIEEGDLDAIPGKTYALGFIRTYAESLGFDGEEVVGEVKRQLQAGETQQQVINVAHREPVKERRWPSTLAIAASILGIGIVYGGWTAVTYWQDRDFAHVAALPGDIATYVASLVKANDPEPETQDVAATQVELPVEEEIVVPAQPPRFGDDAVAAPLLPEQFEAPDLSGAPVLLATLDPRLVAGEPAALPVVVANAIDDVLSEPASVVYGAADGTSRITLIAKETSWLRIESGDGSYSWTRTLEAGERFFMPDRRDLSLWTGNAGGLGVIIDGRDIGPLGDRGAVMRDVILLPEELLAAAQ